MNRCLFVLMLATCAAAGCNTPSDYRVPYTQAVTEVKAMYPVPTSDDPEYRKALAQTYPAYSPEAMEVPGFPIQWSLAVTEGESTPNMEYRVNILKNWQLMPARRTNISVQAVGASAVRVNVTSEKQMGGDVWARDYAYEMQRRNEIDKRFKALAAQGPSAPAPAAGGPAAAPRKFAPIGQKAPAGNPPAVQAARPAPVTPANRSGRAAVEPPMAPPPTGSLNDEPQTVP